MHQPTRRAGRLLAGVAVIAAAGLTIPAHAMAAGSTGARQTYLVVYKGASTPTNAATAIRSAGGSVVANYAGIGVVVARSDNTAFGDRMRANSQVEGAAATTQYATRLRDVESANSDDSSGPPPGDLPNAPAGDADSLSGLQWDMRQIHTPQAHAVTGGSPTVVVGDIDTGIDYRHPDLRQNIDDANSANCVGGTPVPGAGAANDDNGHGTHTAGTIAAASNGYGIVGVAPNVKIASIKAGDADGFFYPEAVVCSFMWAGSRHLDVTNNSYFADPFLFNCKNDPVQRAIWKAEQRAIRYAMQQGVTVVAAEGNESEDLSHPTVDKTSPDNGTTPETRTISNDCVVIPVEIPGVIGVTASGNSTQGTSAGQYPDHLKSFYSSYGVSSADVVAPGGDSRYGRTAEAPNGRVLSTWPANRPCSRSVQEPVSSDSTYPTAVYCYLQGTSMASPHVAGVAALVISRFGDLQNPQNGKMRPTQVEQFLEQTADPQTCPDRLPVGYASVLGTNSGAPQQCQGGGKGHTSWYGNGEVDAFNAVTHSTSNR
jgi:subtilisin family serine protease